MRLTDLSLQISRSITQNKVRTGLTILGIVIGISSVIMMLSIGQGAQNSVQESIASIGSQTMTVSTEDAKYPLRFEDADMLLDQIPEVLGVSNVVQKNGTAKLKDLDEYVTIYGVEARYPDAQTVDVLDGQFFTDSQNDRREKVTIIGASLEDDLFGTETGIGQTILIEGVPFAVIGVFDSDDSVGFGLGSSLYIPIDTYLSYISNETAPASISVKISSTEVIPTVKPYIERLMHESRRLNVSEDVFAVADLTSLLNAASQVTQVFTVLLAGIGSISLVVGGIGIMNMMLTTVTERTREIGLRKALGARKEDIVLQFLMESAVLTVIGGIIGIAIGVLMSWAMGKLLPDFEPVVTIGSMILAVCFSAAVGLFFGYYPSKKAANLNPIDALRYE